jgi:membrane protein implicated in regulation of membrane protease activity
MVKYSSLERGFPAGSPLASALVIIVGALAIAASIVVGFFAFVILGSLLLVLAAVVSIRLWWFRRKMTRNPAFQASANARPTGAQETIEGEYHVVIEERQERQG